MKAKIFPMAIIGILVLIANSASAEKASDQPVSMQNVTLLEERVIENNPGKEESNNKWERRREGWGRERHHEGWGRERRREGW